MMFILRSAFWLTLAFVVIRPEIDMRDTAAALSSEALARGSQFVGEQIDAMDCNTLQCHGGKALAVAALDAAKPAPLPVLVPLPRPRPERLS